MHAHRGIALLHIVLIVAVCAAVLAALYFAVVDPYYARLLRLRVGDMMSEMPAELRDARFLLMPWDGGGLYTQGNLSHTESGIITTDVAYAADTSARIEYHIATQESELVVNGRTLFSTQERMRALFLSADGTHVSVAMSTSSEESVLHADQWRVRVVDVVSDASWETAGFSAPFKDADTAYVFDAGGVHLFDYQSGTKTLVLAMPTQTIYLSVAENESRTKLAWTTVGSGDARVYAATGNPEVPLLLLAEMEDVYGSVALTEENLYVLAQRDGRGTDLVRYDLFEPETVHSIRSFPPSVSLSKLIP